MAEPVFFNQIDDVSIAEVMDFITKNPVDVIVKVQNKHVKTRTLTNKKTGGFSVEKFSFSRISSEKITCSLNINDNTFFFKSVLSSDDDDCRIETPQEIYQLFKRNNFRVSMPIGYPYTCNIIYLNGKKTEIKAELRDLSLGGCLLSIPQGGVEIKKDDEVDILLKVDRFDFSKLSLSARMIKPVEDEKALLIGCSFYSPNGELLAEIQAMLMLLDRVHRKKIYD